MAGMEPRRLALRFRPPALIVEYARPSGGPLFHHEVDLSGSLASENVHEIVEEMTRRHAAVLGSDKVSAQQLERLVTRLVEHGAASRAMPLPQADYNRVSESQLKQVKQKMDVVFAQNIVRPGEEGYQYDKRVAFQAAQEASEWDDE